jgi:solute carrier family 25 phosphate transporter 23/24/25/41
MPDHQAAATTLRAVFTFYSDILTLTSEGDSVLNDETVQSLGTNASSLIKALFGSILKLASSPAQHQTQLSGPPAAATPSPDSPLQASSPLEAQGNRAPSTAERQTALSVGYDSDDEGMETDDSRQYASPTEATTDALRGVAVTTAIPPAASTSHSRLASQDSGTDTGLGDEAKGKESLLIKYLPSPGYFFAGAVAGGISRTCTAPLDRLKVYLLVSTKTSTTAALDAAKQGRPLSAITNAGRSLSAAFWEIKAAGGVRGFFAGMFSCSSHTHSPLTNIQGNGLNVFKIMPETAIRVGAT